MGRYLVEWYLNGELQEYRTMLVDTDTLYNMVTSKGLSALLYLQTNNDCIGVYIKYSKIIGCSDADTIYQKITDLLKKHQYRWWLANNEPNTYWDYIFRELW